MKSTNSLFKLCITFLIFASSSCLSIPLAGSVDSTPNINLSFSIPAGGTSITLPLDGQGLWGNAAGDVITWSVGCGTVTVGSLADLTCNVPNVGLNPISLTVNVVGNPSYTKFGYQYGSSWNGSRYLTSVNSWSGPWTDFEAAFHGTKLLTSVPTNLPSSVTSLRATFFSSNINSPNIALWDVSHVQDFYYMFYGTPFNQNIGAWNTSSATNMFGMFVANHDFNQNIGNWDVSHVQNFGDMFYQTKFNQNIGAWNTSSATDMNWMFQGDYAFNQNIGAWDTSNVTDMSGMFQGDFAFNQNIGAWNVSNVQNFSNMFAQTKSFNQNIGAWNTSSATNMSGMFSEAIAFNQNIGAWDTSNVTDMSTMFRNAIAFNQNVSAWNTSNVTNRSQMFSMSAPPNNRSIGVISSATLGGFGVLTSVSCTSATSCTAVGGGLNNILILSGNPATWALGDVREISSATLGGYAALYSVSCTSATSCTAVGNDAYQNILTLAGNPSSWAFSDVREISSATLGGYASLNSVSCTSATNCTAVGYDGAPGLTVITGNPATWALGDVREISSASLGGYVALNSVSCTSATSCTAVGYDAYQNILTLAGNPSSWAFSDIANQTLGAANGFLGYFFSLFCTSSSACTSVGTNLFGDIVYEWPFTAGSSSPPAIDPIVYSKPTAPSNVTASLSNGTATVSFTPGTSGNLPTYNQIDMYINGQPVGNVCNVIGATSCLVSNLGPNATFSFTVTAVNAMGSAASAVSNAVSYASPTTVPPTTTTTTTTVPAVKRTITCVKGKISKKITAVSPVCPAGYKKK